MPSVFLLLAASFAGDAVSGAPSAGAAEYVRLSEEMDRSAARANWVAVERLLDKMAATGVPHTPAVLLVAAQSARATGDIATLKARLLLVNQARPDDEEVKSWLWRIQNEYGPVLLAADLPANYRLTPGAMPFNPEHRAAVEFAQGRILEDSYFDGLLPKGQYRFAPYGAGPDALVFEFEVRQNRQRFDLRTKEEPTRRDRKKRERLDRRLEREPSAGGSSAAGLPRPHPA